MKKLLTFIPSHSVSIIVSALFVMFIAFIALIVIGSNFSIEAIISIILTVLLGLFLALTFNYLRDYQQIGQKPADKK